MATQDQEQNVPQQDVQTTASDDGVNWADLATDFGDEGASIAEPVGADGSEYDVDSTSESVAPESDQSTDQTTQHQESEQPTSEQAEAESTQESQTPQESTPVTPEQTPEEYSQPQYPQKSPEELRQEYEQGLEQAYAISEDDAIALASQPETVLPRLAKNLHMNVMQEVVSQLQQLQQNIPQMMEQRVEQSQREEKAKQEFYEEWPGLKDYHGDVLRNAMMVRQSNPNATRKQVIEMAGMMTAMAKGVDPAQVRRQAQQQTQQQPAARPAQPRGPAKPASPGSPPNAAPTMPDNVFEQFADDDRDFLGRG